MIWWWDGGGREGNFISPRDTAYQRLGSEDFSGPELADSIEKERCRNSLNDWFGWIIKKTVRELLLPRHPTNCRFTLPSWTFPFDKSRAATPGCAAIRLSISPPLSIMFVAFSIWADGLPSKDPGVQWARLERRRHLTSSSSLQ